MSLSAQRNFCLLAFAGVLWTAVILWTPMARWQWGSSISHVLETDLAIRCSWARSLPPGQWVCGHDFVRLDDQLEKVRPPENWQELSILLLIPGLGALAVGLLGTTAGLFAGGSGTGIRPSKGTRSFHARAT